MEKEKWVVEVTACDGCLPNTYEECETPEEAKELVRSLLTISEEERHHRRITDWDGNNPLVIDLGGEALLAYKEEN